METWTGENRGHFDENYGAVCKQQSVSNSICAVLIGNWNMLGFLLVSLNDYHVWKHSQNIEPRDLLV